MKLKLCLILTSRYILFQNKFYFVNNLKFYKISALWRILFLAFTLIFHPLPSSLDLKSINPKLVIFKSCGEASQRNLKSEFFSYVLCSSQPFPWIHECARWHGWMLCLVKDTSTSPSLLSIGAFPFSPPPLSFLSW